MANFTKEICPQCGKECKKLSMHLKYCQVNPEKENEPVQPEPVEAPKPSKIKLKFRQSVWIGINGKVYEGSEIEVDDIIIASEIVRLAKEAHGWDVLI
jgi:hypothetical protein